MFIRRNHKFFVLCNVIKEIYWNNKIFYTEKVLQEIFDNFKISQIRTPSLEHTNLFERSVGNSSDIVNKELYTFFDKNDRSIALRPEGTASVIRSLIEKKLDGDFHKLWYLGSMWRYERPQMGRYRQFNQAGVEILGYKEGMAEFEMISMVCSINHRLKIEKRNELRDKEQELKEEIKLKDTALVKEDVKFH